MNVLAIDFYAARIRPQLATDQFQQGRLAGAAWTHDCGDAFARNIHVDAVKDHSIATAKPETADLNYCVAQVGFLGYVVDLRKYFYYLERYCMRLLRLMHHHSPQISQKYTI